MKFSAVAIAAIAPLASAHYVFNSVLVEGVATKPDQYVRPNTRQATYNPTKWENVRDDMTPDVNDFRCNKGAFTNAAKTGTLEVKAGSKMSFKLAIGTMQHPGPGIVYMSKAPTTAKAYEGDGDWFKIYEESVCDKTADFTNKAWCTWDKPTIDFTVPKDTPDGEYLLRVEHIGVHGAHVGQAEFYNSCAQVKITGGGNGTPGPMIRFPGGYKKTDPSFNFSIYNGFKPYPMPGPAVWTGGNSAGNATEPEPTTPVPAASSAPANAAPAQSAPAKPAPVKPTPSTSAPAPVKPTPSASASANTEPVSPPAGNNEPKKGGKKTPCKRSVRRSRVFRGQQ